MKNKILPYNIILIYLLSVGSISAQQVWTLEKCIDRALNSSFSIHQADFSVQQAEIDNDIAKLSKYPDLNGNVNVGLNFGRSVDPTTNSFITSSFFSNNYGLNSNITLFNAGRIKNTLALTGYDLEAAEQDKEQLKNDLALQVATLYLNVLFARENIDVAEKQNMLNQQQLDQMNKFINAGTRPKSDRLNLESQIAQGNQSLVTAKNNAQLAHIRLKQLLRIPPDKTIEISVPDDIPITTDPYIVSFKEVFEQAVETRPNLRANELRYKGAETNIEIAKSGYYPSIGLGLNLGTNYSNQAIEVIGTNDFVVDEELILNGMPFTLEQQVSIPITQTQRYGSQLSSFLSYGLGVGIQIPIYNKGQIKGSVQRAELNLETQKLNKQQLLETLSYEIQEAIANARAAKDRLAASELSLEAQGKAFANAQKKLELGAATTYEWENQKILLENAEVNKLIDKYDYIFKVKILEFYQGKLIKL